MKISSVLLVLAGVLIVTSARAQDVFTTAPGAWNNTGIWSSPIVPTAANTTTITVLHDVTIPAGLSVTIDGTTIGSGANLTVQSGGTLTISAGAGSLTVNGQLTGQQGSLINGSDGTNISFASGSKYRHEFSNTQGIIPLASWSSGSTLEVAGYTAGRTMTAVGNWSQNFGAVNIACTALNGTLNFSGLLNQVTGDLTIGNNGSGSGIIQLLSSQNSTISIGGSLNISSTGRLQLSTTGSPTVNIGNDFNFTSTSSGGSLTSTSGQPVINIGRDFIMNASTGLLRIGYTGFTGGATFNVGRDFNLVSGTLSESSNDPGTGILSFSNSSSHHFTNSGTISNRIDYVIGANDVLIVQNESLLTGGINSQLDLSGSLVVNSLNASGAIQTGYGVGGAGNLWTQIRNFQSGSKIIFQGSGSQVIGSGHPTAAALTTVINNTNGVSLNSPSSTVSLGSVQLMSGTLQVSNNNLTLAQDLILSGGTLNLVSGASAKTLTIAGNFQPTSGLLSVTSGAATAEVMINGDILSGTGTVSFSGANNRITVGGTGAFTSFFPLAGASSIKTINVTRGGGGVISFGQNITATDVTVNTGGIDMNGNLTVTNNLNLASGTTLFFEGHTLQLQKLFNNTLTGGVLSADGTSTLNITGTGSLGTLAFSPSGNTLGTLTFNRTSGGAVTLNSALTIQTAMTLQSGIFTNTSGLGFSSGALLTRNSSGSITGAIPTGGPYHLRYVGSSLSSGQEAKGSLNNVTSNVSGTVTLTSVITASGTLTVSTGTFTCGANGVTANAFSNATVFNAPSGLLTISSNFANNGTYNKNSGTVVFNGTTTLSGSVNPQFHHLTISGVLNSPATLNLAGHFTNNGTFNQGTNTVLFSGAALQNIAGTALTRFYNLNVTNSTSPVSVSVESKSELQNVLTLGANATFDADGASGLTVFTLRSTNDNPVQDASIAALSNGASVTGKISMQRYMSAEGKIDRYLSMPLAGVRVDSIQDDFSVTGPFTGTSYPCTGCKNNGTSLRYYNESVLGAITLGWSNFPSAVNSEQFTVGRGYDALMWDGTKQVTWDARGTINSGTIALPVTQTPSSPADPNSDGWNLVGNPFLSGIKWDNGTGWSRTNIAPIITVPEVHVGSYINRTYNYVDGSGDLNGGVIVMGQAFWVYASASGPALSVNENAKMTGGTFYREAPRSKSKQLIVELSNGAFSDRSFLKLNDEASDDFDFAFDGYKLRNDHLYVSLLDKDQARLVMHTLNRINDNQEIPLSIWVSEPGAYSFTFPGADLFSADAPLLLWDKETGATYPVNSSEAYRFTINKAESENPDRFSLINSKNSPEQLASNFITIFPNPASSLLTVSVADSERHGFKLIDSNGREILNGEMNKENNTIDVSSFVKGIYILKIENQGQMIHKKILIK
jgi:hypothetical protein